VVRLGRHHAHSHCRRNLEGYTGLIYTLEILPHCWASWRSRSAQTCARSCKTGSLRPWRQNDLRLAPRAARRGAKPSAAESTVTLPLKLLPLLDKKEAAKPKPPIARWSPPHSSRAACGRALIVEAHFEVAVLAEGEWSKVPLLPLGPR